jgi:hypothetical protein
VEQGRWSRRGTEDVKNFSASENAIVSNSAKLAIKGNKDQGEVWKSVALAQGKLARALRVSSAGPAGAGLAAGYAAVAAPLSPTSLQLSLENKAVNASIEKHVAALRKLPEAQPGAIGYVFAINGEIQSADIYASPGLFQTLWPKQAHALAVEMISEQKKATPAALTPVAALDFLRKAEAATAQPAAAPNSRTRVVKKDSAKVLYVESHDSASKSWVHRSYTAK